MVMHLCATVLDLSCTIFYCLDTLDTPPVITQHPMNVTINLVNDSTNVSLTCEANGALCYTWEREDGVLVSNSTVAGVNNTNITLINIRPEDAGNYQCVAINTHGHNKSDNATVTINGTNCIME